ncbi:MAG: hypothetical protein QXR09_02265 [Candidatus Aenigmatarchaeota archaeon]
MKVDPSLIALLLASIFLLCLIIWLIFHSEFVSHGEFLSAIIGIFGALLTGFWSLWKKVSDISESIGFLKSEILNVKKDVASLKKEVSMMKRDMSLMKKEISVMKKDIAFIKKKI